MENEKKIVKKKGEKKKSAITTLNLKTEHDIALDFATKVYKKLGQPIKSIVLFGSTVKKSTTLGSDIDIVIIIDDVSIKWDMELTSWYREELDKIISSNPYSKSLHINTVKLSTWWEDILKGDPTVINIIRYGEPIIDLAGFFEPLKYLLLQGKIKGTPEAIYSCLQRAPSHLARSKMAELGAIEGIYWSMVDSAHAALISAKILPASPEHIAIDLKVNFVDSGMLKQKHVDAFKEVVVLYKQIAHNEINQIKSVIIDDLQQKAEEFLGEMVRIVKTNIE